MSTPPPLRTHHVTDTAVVPGKPRFSVLSWNTLADGLAQNGSFSRCPASALAFSHRLPLLLEEIYRHDADIVILQEVNRHEAFDSALSERGYVGAFARKAFSACTGLGFPEDGVAIFFRASRFKLVDAPKQAAYVSDGHPMSQCWLSLSLLDKEAQRPLLVATTHLKAKNTKEFAALRLNQARQLVTVLEATVEMSERERPGIVLGGDFNALLSEACCEEITRSQLELTPCTRDVPPELAFSTWKYRRSDDGSEFEKCCVIDHMWHCAQLTHVATRAQPTKEECGPGALPSPAYASDHLAQWNAFQWR